MANNPTISLDVVKFRTTKQDNLLKMLKDKKVNEEVAERVKDAINEFVPQKTGELRRKAKVKGNKIIWGNGLKYAGYQYRGIVYAPNFPGAMNGNPAWKSSKGKGSKYPTERKLGDFTGTLQLYPRWQKGKPKVKGTLVYKFGYTTPGTHHHWDEYFKYEPKLKANQEITRYLNAECKARGLKT